MTTYSPTKSVKELIWLSDLHLDQATNDAKDLLWAKLNGIRYDAALITGDLSTSVQLQGHLAWISKACSDRPVFFVTGNHEYFGNSIEAVEQAVEDTCRSFPNLHPLVGGGTVRLTSRTILVGHRGWYDGQAGSGASTWVDCPDRHLIEDFKGLSRSDYFKKLRELGIQSADYFRRVLPWALSNYPTVLIAMHVPPFTQATRHRGDYCSYSRQPYFCNQAAGNAIMGISRQFPNRRIIVHAGHTHCAVHVKLSNNLEVKVAGSQPGFPTLQDVLQIK